MNPPLIAHVIFRLDIGGLENGLVNLINLIPEDRYRHAILCLNGYSDFRLRIRRSDVEILDLKKREGQDPGMHVRLFRALQSLRPDILHTRNLSAMEAAPTAALAGVKLRIHGEHGRDMSDLDGSSRKYRLIRRAYAPFVHHFIALSRDLEGYLEEKVGISSEKITQIYNGVDTGKFHPAERKGSSGNLVFGTVGRMQAVKDQTTLARAFIRLIEMAPQMKDRARLVMVGDGPLRQEAAALLDEAGLSDLAWLPGARDDIPEQMRNLDVFILPSLAEGISNTILEAMASGLPVIATNVGGNPELVEEGLTGFLVPPADPGAMAQSMLRYLADPALVARQSVSAKKSADERFSMQAMVESYLNVYDRQLATRRKRI